MQRTVSVAVLALFAAGGAAAIDLGGLRPVAPCGFLRILEHKVGAERIQFAGRNLRHATAENA
jgi:hypothetical protein